VLVAFRRQVVHGDATDRDGHARLERQHRLTTESVFLIHQEIHVFRGALRPVRPDRNPADDGMSDSERLERVRSIVGCLHHLLGNGRRSFEEVGASPGAAALRAVLDDHSGSILAHPLN
jgi:hypothetical protein